MKTREGLWRLSPSGLYSYTECQSCFWVTCKNMLYSYFQGTIEARQIEGTWRLWDATIKRVEDPDYIRFYE